MAEKRTVSRQDVVCHNNQLITMLTHYNNKILNNPQKYMEIVDEVIKEINVHKKKIKRDA